MIPYQDIQKTRHFPFVTILLILINASVFAYQLLLPPPGSNRLLYEFAVIPLEFKRGGNLPFSMGPIPIVTTFTSLFLHGGILHLIGNMLYLWIFGDNVEDRLGPVRFLIFYTLCGIIASFTQVYANFNSEIPMVGASGAIAGVLGGYLWIAPKAKVKVLIPVFYFLRTAILPAWIVLTGWALIQFLHVQLAPPNASGGIGYYAHIGGFVAGLLLLPAFRRRRR
ncbi:MAG: rhomboid family intramembrane serine protease [Deltaproteobacteria bacterium]|nr:rhomboid family intramembrane serine protease [Deltaproteobacteria bacterium]